MIRYIASTLFAVALLSAPSSAQTLPEGMTMHRIAAGNLDASGWTDAASTQGGFSVRLPIKFNDFTVAVPNKGAVSKMFVVGGKDMAGVKFTAMRMQYRQKGLAQSYFAKFETGKAIKGATVKPHEFQGRKAVDLALTGSRSLARQRVVLLKDSLVMMIVEYPRALRFFAPQQKIDTFFASLRISSPLASQ